MALKWILANKYKLMVFIVGLYLIADVWQHKGQTRLLFPKNYPAHKVDSNWPKSNNTLLNLNKQWKKAINTIAKLEALPQNQSGFECDVYFYPGKNSFGVHHDWNQSSGLNLETLLVQYKKQKLSASIWLDFKNLNDSNATASLNRLIELKKQIWVTASIVS